MTIEKKEEKYTENDLPELYRDSMNILTEGGISYAKALDLIEKLHLHFYGTVSDKIINHELADYLKSLPDEGKSLDWIDTTLIKVKLMKKFHDNLTGDREHPPRTIYKSPGGVEIMESSNN